MRAGLATERIQRGVRPRPGTWMIGAVDGTKLWAASGTEYIELADLTPQDAVRAIDALIDRGFADRVQSDRPATPETMSPAVALTVDLVNIEDRVAQISRSLVVVLPTLALHLPPRSGRAAAVAIERVLMADNDKLQPVWDHALRGTARILAAHPLPSLNRLLEAQLPDVLAVASLTDDAPQWEDQDASVLVGPSRPARSCDTTRIRTFYLASALAARTQARLGLPEMAGGSVGLTAEESMPRAIGEAYERYTAGVIPFDALTVSPGAELADAVDPRSIIDYTPEQFASHLDLCPYDPAEPRVWTPASTIAGASCHVLADLVYFPFGGPHRSRHTSSNSSGVAAGRTHAEAVTGAWAELLERDAFMRAWLNQEPLPRFSLGEFAGNGHEPYLVDLESQGWEVRAFSLRPQGDLPIVACLAVRDGQLALGASAAASGPEALTKSMREAWSGAVLVPQDGEEVPAPMEVRTPGDHRRLYRWGRHLDKVSYLWDGRGSVHPTSMGELPPPDPSLIIVTWPSWICEPLHVVRAMHPNLIPLTFGFGREPLGRHDVAALLGTTDRSTHFPHPFP